MTTKIKRTLMQIGNVRIIENDALNVEVQRLVSVTSPRTKEVNDRWRFTAYLPTIKKGLEFIVDIGLLIDHNDVEDAESYLEQVSLSEEIMLNAIENRFGASE